MLKNYKILKSCPYGEVGEVVERDESSQFTKFFVQEGCLEEVKEVKEEPLKRTDWTPANNEDYFYVEPNGFIYDNPWEKDRIDIDIYKQNNCFKTKKEALMEKGFRESCVPNTAVEGEHFYAWDFDDDEVIEYYKDSWEDCKQPKFKTNEEALAWGQKNAIYWKWKFD